MICSLYISQYYNSLMFTIFKFRLQQKITSISLLYHLTICCDKIESAKLCALRAHVPTYLACLRAYVLTCKRDLRAYVVTCQPAVVLTCSRPNMPCLLYVRMCSRAITLNDRDKFSITCFPYIFVIVLCLFPVK